MKLEKIHLDLKLPRNLVIKSISFGWTNSFIYYHPLFIVTINDYTLLFRALSEEFVGKLCTISRGSQLRDKLDNRIANFEVPNFSRVKPPNFQFANTGEDVCSEVVTMFYGKCKQLQYLVDFCFIWNNTRTYFGTGISRSGIFSFYYPLNPLSFCFKFAPGDWARHFVCLFLIFYV